MFPETLTLADFLFVSIILLTVVPVLVSVVWTIYRCCNANYDGIPEFCDMTSNNIAAARMGETQPERTSQNTDTQV